MCNRVTNHGDMGTFSKPAGTELLQFPSLEEERASGECIFLFRICEKNYIYNYYKKSAEILNLHVNDDMPNNSHSNPQCLRNFAAGAKSQT